MLPQHRHAAANSGLGRRQARFLPHASGASTGGGGGSPGAGLSSRPAVRPEPGSPYYRWPAWQCSSCRPRSQPCPRPPPPCCAQRRPHFPPSCLAPAPGHASTPIIPFRSCTLTVDSYNLNKDCQNRKMGAQRWLQACKTVGELQIENGPRKGEGASYYRSVQF